MRINVKLILLMAALFFTAISRSRGQESSYESYYKYLRGIEDTFSIEKDSVQFKIAESKVQDIIFNEEVLPILSDHPDWKLIDTVLAKYPRVNGERVIGQTVVKYFGALMDRKDAPPVEIKNAIEIASIYDKRFSTGNYNAWAWILFTVSNNKKDLKVALEWSRKALKQFTPGTSDYGVVLDTYANLLYKLGRSKEAIKFEKEAVSLRPEDDQLKAALEKMLQGVKTWE